MVARPILLLASVNHRSPSGPAVIVGRRLLAVGILNSVMTPPVVIRPILLPSCSVNQRAPSGPGVMPDRPAVVVGTDELGDDAGGGDPADLVAG